MSLQWLSFTRRLVGRLFHKVGSAQEFTDKNVRRKMGGGGVIESGEFTDKNVRRKMGGGGGVIESGEFTDGNVRRKMRV